MPLGIGLVEGLPSPPIHDLHRHGQLHGGYLGGGLLPLTGIRDHEAGTLAHKPFARVRLDLLRSRGSVVDLGVGGFPEDTAGHLIIFLLTLDGPLTLGPRPLLTCLLIFVSVKELSNQACRKFTTINTLLTGGHIRIDGTRLGVIGRSLHPPILGDLVSLSGAHHQLIVVGPERNTPIGQGFCLTRTQGVAIYLHFIGCRFVGNLRLRPTRARDADAGITHESHPGGHSPGSDEGAEKVQTGIRQQVVGLA